MSALARLGRALDRGIRRMKGAIASSGAYEGARSDRTALQSWSAGGGSADADLNPDLETLRDRSRDLIRNNALARGTVSTVVTKVVSTGLSLQARPDIETLGWTREQGKAWRKTVEREWLLYSESPDCDITRRLNVYALQALALRATLSDGDCFALLPMKPVAGFPYSTRVQLIEADRVANPNGQRDTEQLSAGVEMDEHGAPIAYHILKHHPGSVEFPSRLNGDTDRVRAFGELTGRRNVIQLLTIERPGQSRGAPYLAPVIEPLKQLTRYRDAELMKAIVQSFMTVAIKTEQGTSDFGEPIKAQPDVGLQTAAATPKTIMGHGNVVDLEPGETAEMLASTSPNQNFDPFTLSILRQIGVGLEIPFEVLVKHFTASYSAARAALLEAWQFFRLRREWLAANFCDPVYEAWMDEAVALGRIQAPGYFSDPIRRKAYLRAAWIGDAPGSVDPVKEVEAAALKVKNRFSTHAEETMALTGKVWDETVETLGEEHAIIREKGLVYDPHPEAFERVEAVSDEGDEGDKEKPDEKEDEKEAERRGAEVPA